MDPDAWNDTFTVKYKDAEIRKPTEEYITNLLLSYLTELDYDVGKISSLLKHESKEEQMIMKVRLCSLINKFYKISSDKNSFQYYDLINPSYKKMQHMFTNLLNYYLWFAQVKSKILYKTENIINDRDEAMMELRKLKQEHEMLKAKAKTVINIYFSFCENLQILTIFRFKKASTRK